MWSRIIFSSYYLHSECSGLVKMSQPQEPDKDRVADKPIYAAKVSVSFQKFNKHNCFQLNIQLRIKNCVFTLIKEPPAECINIKGGRRHTRGKLGFYSIIYTVIISNYGVLRGAGTAQVFGEL